MNCNLLDREQVKQVQLLDSHLDVDNRNYEHLGIDQFQRW